MKTYQDIVGDGGSDVVGQVVEQRRAIEEALGGVRHLVAVGSGKGGVGKSTATALLALALRHGGSRVAVLDADLNGPSQARLLGVEGAPWIPTTDGRGISMPRRSDGLGVLSMGSVVDPGEAVAFESLATTDEHVWRSTREFSLLGQLLASTDWGELDVLLVDLPPGAERMAHFAGFLPKRCRFLMVTIPSGLARSVVDRSLAALEDAGASVVGILENMAGYRCPDCGSIQPLFPGPERPDTGPHEVLASLPFDPRIAEASDAGWREEHRPLIEELETAGLTENLRRGLTADPTDPTDPNEEGELP